MGTPASAAGEDGGNSAGIMQESLFWMVQLSFTLTGNFFGIMTKKYNGTSLHSKFKEKKGVRFSVNDDVSQIRIKLS